MHVVHEHIESFVIEHERIRFSTVKNGNSKDKVLAIYYDSDDELACIRNRESTYGALILKAIKEYCKSVEYCKTVKKTEKSAFQELLEFAESIANTTSGNLHGFYQNEVIAARKAVKKAGGRLDAVGRFKKGATEKTPH